MSKKNKNKFKKQIKAQMLQEISQAQAQQFSIKKGKKSPAMQAANPTNIMATETTGEAMALNNEFNLPQIKYDLKKTGIVIFILAATIGALYYIDLKNNILLHFGDWLFSTLNIK